MCDFLLQGCISGQVPSRPLIDSGNVDGGHNYIAAFLTPFEVKAVIHTVNFYAGNYGITCNNMTIRIKLAVDYAIICNNMTS